MNNSLLNDTEYIKFMNNTIDKFIIENKTSSPQRKWELLKVEIKMSTIQFSTEKNKIIQLKYKNNFEEITRISNLLVKDPNCPTLNQTYNSLKLQQELFDLNQSKGAQIRSKIKYIEEGEKNTKYFLNMEKARANLNTIHELNTNNNTILDPILIVDEIKTFYSDLYAKDNTIDDSYNSLVSFLKISDYPVLTEEDKLSCEGELSLSELSTALSSLNNDSSAGCDGISTSFYKFFWKKLKYILLECFNDAIKKGELSTNQKRGIITLLHKGGDRTDLSNWRPISLLNSDYKIFSKVIANRIKHVLPNIISDSQKGFLKGRNISDLIRNIDDILKVTHLTNSTGLLASVDFKKAFDTLSKNAILNCMKIFNFGPYLINLVSVLMHNSESCVKNSGWLSSWFQCNRGVRQGCSTSPYLFILVAEFLSIRLRSDSIINDIVIPSNDTKISRIQQYADDTTLFLKTESDLEFALSIIDDFGKVCGLKLNRNKSVILPIGNFERDYFSTSEVKWLNDDEVIKIAGVFFGAKLEASKIELNWKTKIEDMVKTINRWNRRNVSLYGKIIICKTFLLSKINYILQSLTLPINVLEEIDRILFKFIWQKKFTNKKTFEKIKRSVMCKEFAAGGLKMISVKDQQKVFHLKWFKKLYHDDEKNNFAHYFLDKLGGTHYLLHCNAALDESFIRNNFNSVFWADVIKTWLSLAYTISNNPVTTVDILSQPLFLNCNIKYKNKPLYIKPFVNGKVEFVADLLQHKELMNMNEIKQKNKFIPCINV